jgi:single-strand DNA-binding protein
MAFDDSVTICGNLARDPGEDLKYTPSGQAVVNFTVVKNTRRKNPDTDQWEDGDPGFYEITAWGQLAENVAESFTKGSRIMVYGELKFDTWVDKETEKNRSKVSIRANDVGASVKWATAEVVKNERQSEGPQRAAPAPKQYPDEAPF